MQTGRGSIASSTWCSCILLQLVKLFADKISREQMIRLNTIHTLVTSLGSCKQPIFICQSSAPSRPQLVFETVTPLHANWRRKCCFSGLVFLHPPTASEAFQRTGSKGLDTDPASIQCSSVKAVPCHVHNSRMLDTITPLHANLQQKRCFSDLVFLHPPAASEAHYRKMRPWIPAGYFFVCLTVVVS